MAAKLGLLPLTHLKKLPQSQDHNIHNLDHHQHQDHHQHHQINPSLISAAGGAWMWNPNNNNNKQHQQQPNQQQEDQEDESWEVRAFAEDTGNIMGTTWPPRSYTCTFCRREFRSAQALGGHMNVHRRDRARLHQIHPNSIINTNNPSSSSLPSSSSPSSLLIPMPEFVANAGGLCLLYQFPNPSIGAGVFHSTHLNACTDPSPSSSPSTLLSISSFPPRNLIPTSNSSQPVNFPASQSLPEINTTTASSDNVQYCESSSRGEEEPLVPTDSGNDEEIDLELRLGHGPTPTC